MQVAANGPGGVAATDVALEPSSLPFTPTNRNGARIVTPKVTEDQDAISETVAISHTVVAADTACAAMTLPNATMEVKYEGGYGPGFSVNDVTVTEGAMLRSTSK